ncbi:MAG: transcription termination factor Rho [Lachnospiraceae bacterium]|nr:transcription termination factor Rho [Lachnospiraceae bacterium]
MKEKLKTLPVSELRTIAKDQNLADYQKLRKSELVDLLAAHFETLKKQQEAGQAQAAGTEPRTAPEPPKPSEKESRAAAQAQAGYREARPAAESAQPVMKDPRPFAPLPPTVSEAPRAYQRTPVRTPETVQRVPARTAETVQRAPSNEPPKSLNELDSGITAEGILEVMADGFGFIRSKGYLSGDDDVYVAPSQIKKFNLRTGDYISGNKRISGPTEKFSALLYINSINGQSVSLHQRLTPFEDLTPVFPHEKLRLVTGVQGAVSLRIIDLLAPVGKGQRGMIVAQPKVGKTTLLKQIAGALLKNHPELHLMILLIDERPEEVTDMQESIQGPNAEVIYSTFDEEPEHHRRVSEMVIERAKRLVELKRDVVILLDSITRLTRAYNLICTPSGRTLSGGLDPAALYMPKRFFGAARAMREGGSLTILATALQETGSRLDDVVYEEFKGTGNMELVLNRKLSERRIFPAIDINKSSTRRDDLLLTPEEMEAARLIHRVTTSGQRQEESTEKVLDLFAATKTNEELEQKIKYMVF